MTQNNHNHFHYNISNTKPRFIPTYYHQQVFVNQNSTNNQIRATPTYQSTAFNVQGYLPITNQHLKHNQPVIRKESVTKYTNNTNQLRQKDLNPDHQCGLGNSKVEWYDHAKQDTFDNIRCGSAQQRKNVDLSSNPVFGGNVYVPTRITNKKQQVNKNNQVQQNKVIDNKIQQVNTVQGQHNDQNKIPQNQSNNNENTEKVYNQTNNTVNFQVLSSNIQQLIQQQVKKQLKNHQESQHYQYKKPQSKQSKRNYVSNKQKINKSLQNKVNSNDISKKQPANINNDVTVGKKNNKNDRKLSRTILVERIRPNFTVVRNK